MKLYITILVLVVLLIGSLGYIFYGKYQDKKEQEKNELIEQENKLINQGITIGAQNAVVAFMNEASKCQPFPIRYENTTINMFALDCSNLAEVASSVLQARTAEAQK